MKNYDTGTKQSELSYDLNTKKQNKKNKKAKIAAIMAAILIPCALFGGIMYNGYVKTEKAYAQIERDYTDLAMSYVTDDTSNQNVNDENMAKKVDFVSLTKQESDIYAWIRIPDTNVDYPILQSGSDKQNNDDYWLNNLDGTTGYPGTIFTETMFGKDFKTFNTVIYGHNMKNQTMFGALHNYTNKDYFDTHPYVYIYTASATYKYQIVCAATVSDAHLAIAYNGYKTESQRQQFLNYLLSNASVVSNINTGIYDNYITLSTCTSNDKQRYVVLAKCVDKVSESSYD